MKTTLNLTLDVTPLLTWIVKLLGRLQKPSRASAPSIHEVYTDDRQNFAETLAKVAESQLGRCEVGACEVEGNNAGPQIREYQKATWLPPGAWAWCAAFVCWCILQAIRAYGLTPKGWTRPRTAGAYDLENWADGKHPHGANAGWRSFSTKETKPRRGDVVTFTWSHVGIVVGYDKESQKLTTVEGNASAANQRDGKTAGEGVVRKTPHLTQIRRILRYVPA